MNKSVITHTHTCFKWLMYSELWSVEKSHCLQGYTFKPLCFRVCLTCFLKFSILALLNNHKQMQHTFIQSSAMDFKHTLKWKLAVASKWLKDGRGSESPEQDSTGATKLLAYKKWRCANFYEIAIKEKRSQGRAVSLPL